MPTLTPAEVNRRLAYNMAGWSVPDDDLPNVPEVSPLDSAQARRWQRQEHLEPRP